MFAVADTTKLVADQVISPQQAAEIESRAREAMVTLAVNSVLCLGILAATFGFIFWLADPVAVALLGSVMLAAGIAVLVRGANIYRMFGNASALIGAGMLMGGATFELIDKYEVIAGWVMAFAGVVVLAVPGFAMTRRTATARFVLGSILLMGLTMHLSGLILLLEQHQMAGGFKPLLALYAAAALLLSGGFIDVRLVSALSIVPFAQALETGTGYFHAAYVFYSPEPTLTILQMALLIAACLWVAQTRPERIARHARTLAVLGFVVANLSALVGSLWGDTIGESIWGPSYADFFVAEGNATSDTQWDRYQAAREAFQAANLTLSANLYSVLWAIALIAMIVWSTHRANRGLFNTAMTFGAIHGYTQAFESFADEPVAYVIGGLAAIPIAWGMWRYNQRLAQMASAN